MIVEEKRVSSSGEDEIIDKFPIGMRVLAVDDDPTCLKVLETFLIACQYEVTVTNHAVTALKMLRENRNKYDLVISDVNMPDMDGFKLLELVGLEMDLPVIMLSAHSDTKLVMKGISHGACDYLLKPVRIEELKNIWQHVIRRKSGDPENKNMSPNQENARAGAGEGATPNGNSDQDGNSNRKRKDQDEDEDEDEDAEGEESDHDGHENESTTQKKPRVVWSMELHRKFVGAVNQLGFDKAVPKKILDLMNVEGLTRENVASHLQKYRLYLKKLTVEPQAGMFTALGSKDSSYLQMCALDGFGDLRSLNSPGRLSSSAQSSYVQGSMLGRLNSTAGLSMRGIASSGMIQSSHSQSLNTSFNTIGKIQQAMFPANRNSNRQTSLELNQLPQSKSTTHIEDFNHINSPTAFMAATGFTDARAALGSSCSSVSTSSSNLLMLQENLHQPQSRAYGNQSSLSVASLNEDCLDVGVCGSPNHLDHSICNESWQAAVQLSKYPSIFLPSSEPFSHDQVPPNNLSNTLSSTSRLDFSSSMSTSTPLENSRGDFFCKSDLIGNEIQNYISKQQWEEHKQDFNQNLNHPFSRINSLVSGNCTMGPFSPSMNQSNASYVAQYAGVENPPLGTKLKSNEDYLSEQRKSHGGFLQNNYDPLDDMMSAMIKQDPSEAMLMDGEPAFDPYSLGSCM